MKQRRHKGYELGAASDESDSRYYRATRDFSVQSLDIRVATNDLFSDEERPSGLEAVVPSNQFDMHISTIVAWKQDGKDRTDLG